MPRACRVACSKGLLWGGLHRAFKAFEILWLFGKQGILFRTRQNRRQLHYTTYIGYYLCCCCCCCYCSTVILSLSLSVPISGLHLCTYMQYIVVIVIYTPITNVYCCIVYVDARLSGTCSRPEMPCCPVFGFCTVAVQDRVVLCGFNGCSLRAC